MHCFERVWICRSRGGSYPAGFMAGQAIASALRYQQLLPDVRALPHAPMLPVPCFEPHLLGSTTCAMWTDLGCAQSSIHSLPYSRDCSEPPCLPESVCLLPC